MKKVNIIIKSLLAVAVVLAILFAPNILKKGEKTDGSKEKLVMATSGGFAPYEYYEGQAIIGVDVDIAGEIAEEMDRELVVKDITFDSLINEVKSGRSDFVAAGMSITEERLKEVDFSIEYAVAKQVVLVRADNSVLTKPEDINGKKVAVQLGTVADQVIAVDYPNVKLVHHKKYLGAAEDLKAGKVDALVMDSLPAAELVKVNPDLKVLEGELFIDKYGMVVKKGNTELLGQINKVLVRLMKENKIDEFVINHSGEVKKEEGVSNFVEGICEDFYKTLIKDERYILILEGLRNTILIAIFAIVIGTVLGTFIALIINIAKDNKHFKIPAFICNIYVNIIRGTPVILQLMILYYVIFRRFPRYKHYICRNTCIWFKFSCVCCWNN